MKMRFLIVLLWTVAVTVQTGFTQQPAVQIKAVSPDLLPRKLDSRTVPNPVQVSPKVISGGLPVGEAAFETLVDWGVRTVISVDAAKPDVATAKRYGLRYVHLPHGYDGVPDDRVRELAKAVRELPGLIYIHCHHGKHRSPAAATVACVAAGMIPPVDGVEILKLAGTSEGYQGLYQSAGSAAPIPPAELDRIDVQFRETVAVPPIAEAMVQLGHVHDHLKQIAAAGWRTPKNHPDLAPPHQALMLREHFTELLRTEEVRSQPLPFRRLLRRSEVDAEALHQLLVDWNPATNDSPPPKRVERLAKRIGEQCKACHVRYRDVPLGGKSPNRSGITGQ